MKRLCGVYGFILVLFPNVIFAAADHFYISGTLGASISHLGGTQQIHYYSGNLTDAYSFNNNNSTRLIAGLNAGFEFAGESFRPAISLGLGLYSMPTPFNFKGQLIETAKGDPGATLYNYHFNVLSTRVMLEAQFIWMIKQFFPFIQIGIGPAWGHLNGYKESPFDNLGYVVLPPFESNTDINLAYQIGLGVGYAFDFSKSKTDCPKERIALGYRYVNLGDNSFGTRGSVYPFRLNTTNLKSNEIFATYTHLFST